MAGKFRIGEWAVAPELNSLERNGRTVHLEPKLMQVLVTLAEHPGEVVSKERIFHRVWAQTFVSDEVLTRSISELRKVFEDNPREPTYIQTITKGGYRLVAPVIAEAAERADALRIHWWEQNRWLLAASAATVLLAAIAFFYFLNGRQHAAASRPRITSLAVLPLTNLSGDTGQDYFADGMTDELTTRLSNIKALRVVSQTSVMHYKGTKKTIPEIARELNVDAVLVGSVLRSGDRVRINAQLIQARSDRHVWAESYERGMQDILALQYEVAGDIARQTEITLTREEQRRFAKAPRVDSHAYQFYLKGRYFLNKRTEYEKGIENFRQSIESDPGFASAYSGLADAYLTKAINGGDVNDLMPRARAAASKAMELDPGMPESHVSLAGIHTFFDWDWPAAEREYKRAIELNTNLASAHQRYSLFLALRRRFEQAKYEAQRAEELDPTSPFVFNTTARVLYYAREYDAAEQAAKKALELDPDYALAHAVLGFVYEQKGMNPEAFGHYEKNLVLWGASAENIRLIRKRFLASGLRGYWEQLLSFDLQQSKIGHGIPDDIARDYAALGKNEESLAWWNKAYQERSPWVLALAVDPALDQLHSKREFRELVQRIGMPE